MLRSYYQTLAPTAFRAFHTSTTALASARKQASSITRKKNIIHQAQRAKDALSDRPSVVLGTRPSEEAIKWPACDLAKVLVDEDALFSSAASSSGRGSNMVAAATASTSTLKPYDMPLGTVHIPIHPAFGVASPEDQTLLFNHLPQLSAQATVTPGPHPLGSANGIKDVRMESANARELEKANAFARVVDLRNSNAKGIAFENRRRIIEAFSTPENPFDPGRSEVQAALKTYQIRQLWKHLTTFKRDVGNRLGLRKLVHERAKILKYLRNTNRDRYEIVLERLALEPEAVEGELVV